MTVPDLQGDLWAWVQSLPPWQSDLLRRLTTLDEINEQELLDALRMVVAAFGVETSPPAAAPVPIPALGAVPSTPGSAKILSLSELEAVGSVERGQRLDFAADGLTIVFGETGSGKSTYTRVLRRACRASDADIEILPNVLTAMATSPVKAGTAKIEVSLGSSVSAISRDVNAAPEPILAQVSVFDADCAVVYADGESEITYTPSMLRLFERLVSLQVQIKKRIEDAISKLEGQQVPLDGFDRSTRAGALVLGLNENINPETVRALAAVTEDERIRLEDIRKQLAAAAVNDPTKTAAELEQKAAGIERLMAQIASVERALDQTVVGKLISMNGRLVDLARQSADLAATLSASVPRAVGAASWKTLWQAAHEYVRLGATGDQFPPQPGVSHATCPLCHQELGPEVRERLQRLEEFFRGEVERESRELTQARDATIRSLPRSADLLTVIEQVPLLFGADPTGRVAEGYLRSAADRAAAIFSSATAATIQAPPLAPSPVQQMQAVANDLRRRGAEQRSLVKPEVFAKFRSEVAELENRLRLADRLQLVLDRIEALRKAARFRAASSALTTTGLSRKIGEFTDSAVTAQLRSRLAEELNALHVAHLPIAIGARGAKGKTQVSLQLTASRKVGVRQVLSEGEQRAAALAFFLAEVAVAEHGGGVVLDDPVSSLDHARRSYVAERLVEEALKRQTIVFTHDVVFLLELQDLATRRKAPCELRVVRRVGDAAGIASKDIPWVAQNVGQRVKYLRNELQRLGALERKGDVDVYRREVKTWFELLREAWERSVEEKLLNGVVQRFQPGIQTLRLAKVTVTKEMTDAIEKGMTDASAWTHDQAPALNKPPPTSAQMSAALRELDDFASKFKS